MDAEATVQPVSDLVVVHETVTSYVLRPSALLARAPQPVPEGAYVARFDSGGDGNPSFALLPYTDGEPAATITLADPGEATERSPRYVRMATRPGAADYQLHMPATFPGWTPPGHAA